MTGVAALPICVIGGGLIGLRHAEQAMASKAARLTAVVEPYAATRKKLIAAGLPAVSSIEDVPAETCGAIVATPTPDHLPSSLACLERGWAVLTEKPLTATLAEADQLIAAAKAKGVPLLTGHHRRCHPFSIRAREILPTIGRLVAAQLLWSLRKHDSYFDVSWRKGAGGGPILINLSHEIDLLRFITGEEIVSVSAMTSNAARGFAIEDTAAATLRLTDGVLVSVTISDAGASPWSFEAASGENPMVPRSSEDSMRFMGTEGALSFPSLTLWRDADGEAPEWRRPMIANPPHASRTIDPIRAQIERFIALVSGGEDDVLATARDGRQTMAVIEAITAAAATGQTIKIEEKP